MTVIKRNQLIVLALAIMIIAAGYLNFTYQNSTDPYVQELTGNVGEKLGEATFVEQDSNVDGIGYAEPVNSNINGQALEKKNDEIIKGQNSQEVQTNNIEEYFTQTRLEKERARDKEISLHEKILSNSSVSKDAQNKAQVQLTAISQNWEKEMIIERLIKAKGFKDTVVFINEESVNVVILNGSSLTTVQAAQVQDIVMRETKVPIENIKIVTK